MIHVLSDALSLIDVPVPSNVTSGVVVSPPKASAARSIHGKTRFLAVKEGSVDVRFRDGRVTVPEQHIGLLPPGDDGGFVFDRLVETRFRWVHLAFEEHPRALWQGLETVPWPIPLTAGTNALVKSLCEQPTSRLATAQQIRCARGLELLWRYVGESLALEQRQPVDARLEAALEVIDERLAEPLTLPVIAAAAYVSDAQLVRLFRAELGTTPMRYVWQRRVDAGVQLLQESGLTAGVVARQVGFRTLYHFSRRVKEATGRSPHQLRAVSGTRCGER